MSRTNYLRTKSLKVGDTLLVNDSSIVSVAKIAPDEFDEERVWLTLTCHSGNHGNFDSPWCVDLDADWKVLHALR